MRLTLIELLSRLPESDPRKQYLRDRIDTLTTEEMVTAIGKIRPRHSWSKWLIKAVTAPITAPADILQFIADIAQGRDPNGH